MARGFDENERDTIRRALMEKGKELFARHGLKKTSVSDLTQAAGIAQGTFYLFFASKEELLFEILENEEREMRKESEALMTSEEHVEEYFRKLLTRALEYMESNELLKRIHQGNEMERVLRKLPKEKVEQHMNNDASYLLPMVELLKKKGGLSDIKPETVVGILRSFFLLSMYKREIGEDAYPDVMRFFIDAIAQGITK